MISAIVTSLDSENLLVSPTSEVDLNKCMGKKARYLDKSERVWPATVTAIEDPYLVLRFDNFPTGLGQGQIVEIMEDGDNPQDFAAVPDTS